jgi:NADPH:quinone reductase-like Zn-dependent oxidoreductase
VKAAEIAAQTSSSGGVDHVIEVGGAGTLAQSFAAVGFGGEIALIGVLTREGDTNPRAMMFKGASLRGIFVGSRGMAERLNAFVDAHSVKPVIDRTFAIEDAREAWTYQASPALFGKVVITL